MRNITMDHDHIEQFNIVDRYVMSNLVEEECAQFEEHFIDCPKCIDRVKSARGLKQGVRLFTVEQAARLQSHAARRSPRLSLKWFSGTTWRLAASSALLGVFLVSVPAILQIRNLKQEATRTHQTLSDLQRLREEDQQSALASAQDHEEIQQDLRGRVQQLESDLLRAQNGRADPTAKSNGWLQPVINLPIVVLNSIRSSDIVEIKLPRTPTDLVFSLPLEGKAKYRTYRVTLLKDLRSLWESHRAKPDADNALTVGVNSIFFQPGRYVFEVEGIPTAPGSGGKASYPLRVIKQP